MIACPDFQGSKLPSMTSSYVTAVCRARVLCKQARKPRNGLQAEGAKHLDRFRQLSAGAGAPGVGLRQAQRMEALQQRLQQVVARQLPLARQNVRAPGQRLCRSQPKARIQRCYSFILFGHQHPYFSVRLAYAAPVPVFGTLKPIYSITYRCVGY